MLKPGNIYRDNTRGDFFRLLSRDEDEGDWNIVSASDVETVREWDVNEDAGEWIDPFILQERITKGEVVELDA